MTIITKEHLEELYFNQNLSLCKIGEHFGYKPAKAIIRLFKKYNIEIKKPTIIEKEHLEELYFNQNKTQTEVSAILNITKMHFKKLCKQYEIKLKSINKNFIDKETLIELYINQKLTKMEIATLYNFKSNTAVTNLLRKYKINQRSRSEAMQNCFDKINTHVKLSKEIQEEELKKTSVLQICKKYDVSHL